METEITYPTAVVTGAGSGIGRALATELANNRRLNVVAVGRSIDKLKATQSINPQKIRVVSCDVSNPDDRLKINEFLHSGEKIKYLVHNAAVLGPVLPLSEISLDQWRRHQAINVEGPLFLTQELMPRLSAGRILHISSGAAHSAYEGWGAYCTSKAALHMLYQVLKKELAVQDIVVGSLRPGVVDTDMQNEVRQADRQSFPAIDKFIQLKETSALEKPEIVARFIADVLLLTDDNKFSAAEWDIRNDRHHFENLINEGD